MMRTFLVAVVAARFYQAPSPAVNAPAVSSAVPYMVPVSYGFEQASAFPSAPVAVPVAVPSASPSKVALPLMAGATVGAAVVVLFGGGRKAAKPAAKGAAKPAAKAAAKKPAARSTAAKRAPVSGSQNSGWGLTFGVSPISRGIQPKTIQRPKPPPVKSISRDPFFKTTKGKGGIFPWITNEEGSYAKPLTLSAIDFTSDEADSLIGWGAMPDSVKNLYNPRGRKGLFGGCTTPAKITSRGKRAGGL
jgi:hypothetical protein